MLRSPFSSIATLPILALLAPIAGRAESPRVCDDGNGPRCPRLLYPVCVMTPEPWGVSPNRSAIQWLFENGYVRREDFSNSGAGTGFLREDAKNVASFVQTLRTNPALAKYYLERVRENASVVEVIELVVAEDPEIRRIVHRKIARDARSETGRREISAPLSTR